MKVNETRVRCIVYAVDLRFRNTFAAILKILGKVEQEFFPRTVSPVCLLARMSN